MPEPGETVGRFAIPQEQDSTIEVQSAGQWPSHHLERVQIKPVHWASLPGSLPRHYRLAIPATGAGQASISSMRSTTSVSESK